MRRYEIHGNVSVVRGFADLPKKLQRLNKMNYLVAHRPWAISSGDLLELLEPTDSTADKWDISELCMALMIFAHYHAKCSLVTALGINPELDCYDGHELPRVDTAPPHTSHDNSFSSEHAHNPTSIPVGLPCPATHSPRSLDVLKQKAQHFSASSYQRAETRRLQELSELARYSSIESTMDLGCLYKTGSDSQASSYGADTGRPGMDTSDSHQPVTMSPLANLQFPPSHASQGIHAGSFDPQDITPTNVTASFVLPPQSCFGQKEDFAVRMNVGAGVSDTGVDFGSKDSTDDFTVLEAHALPDNIKTTKDTQCRFVDHQEIQTSIPKTNKCESQRYTTDIGSENNFYHDTLPRLCYLLKGTESDQLMDSMKEKLDYVFAQSASMDSSSSHHGPSYQEAMWRLAQLYRNLSYRGYAAEYKKILGTDVVDFIRQFTLNPESLRCDETDRPVDSRLRLDRLFPVQMRHSHDVGGGNHAAELALSLSSTHSQPEVDLEEGGQSYDNSYSQSYGSYGSPNNSAYFGGQSEHVSQNQGINGPGDQVFIAILLAEAKLQATLWYIMRKLSALKK